MPYCDHGVSAYSECSDTPGAALWDQNVADYLGSGTVSVCERGDLASGGEFSRRCANGSVDSQGDFGYYYNQGIQTIPHVGNNSAYYHTIDGLGVYVTGGPRLVIQAAMATSTAAPDEAPAVPASTLPSSLTGSISALQRTADANGTISTLSAGGDAVSLKTTATSVCLTSTVSGGFLTCDTYADTTAGNLEGAIVCSPRVASDHVLVYGVVPDGAARVSALSSSGTVQSTAVGGNTYRLDMTKKDAAEVTAFSWSTAAGNVHAMSDVLPSDLSCAA